MACRKTALPFAAKKAATVSPDATRRFLSRKADRRKERDERRRPEMMGFITQQQLHRLLQRTGINVSRLCIRLLTLFRAAAVGRKSSPSIRHESGICSPRRTSAS